MGEFLRTFTYDRNLLKQDADAAAASIIRHIDLIKANVVPDKTAQNIITALRTYMGVFTNDAGKPRLSEVGDAFVRLYSDDKRDAWSWLLTRSLWKYSVPNGTSAKVNEKAGSTEPFNFFANLIDLLIALSGRAGFGRFLFFDEFCFHFDDDSNWVKSGLENAASIFLLRTETPDPNLHKQLLTDLEPEYSIPRDNLSGFFQKGLAQTGLFDFCQDANKANVGIALRAPLDLVQQRRIQTIVGLPITFDASTEDWASFLSYKPGNDLPIESSFSEQFARPSESAAPPPQHAVASTLTELAAETHWNVSELEALLNAMLDDPKQLIVSGPPGTGKTYITRKLVDYLCKGDRERWRFVQFHPSVSYESFIEGLQPIVDSAGQMSFRPVAGIVCDFADVIRAREQTFDHYLVIDEINRANLPKVLGELLFLFEYRQELIDLTYTRSFSLPANLRFIATMNSSDRSIKLMDQALRRRFRFVEILPMPNVLRSYLSANGCQIVSKVVEGFESLNALLQDDAGKDVGVGQTYFMQPHLDYNKLLKIWQQQIKPLIDAILVTTPNKIDKYSFESLFDLAS